MDAMNNADDADDAADHDEEATTQSSLPQKPTKKRKTNQERIEILEMVMQPNTTIVAVARETGVNERTIRGWMSKGDEIRKASVEEQPQTNDPVQTLTDQLLSWCHKATEEGDGTTKVTWPEVQEKALELKQEILDSESAEVSPKERTSLEKFKASMSWTKRWMIRHNLRQTRAAAAAAAASSLVGGIQRRKMLSSASSLSSAAQRLRNLIYARRQKPAKAAIALPGVHDALSAKIYASEGAEALFVSGFGVSASRLGVPNVTGILTRSEMEDTARAIITCLKFSDSQGRPPPVIVDMGTAAHGGGAANLRRTVRSMAALGIAAICIQDEALPKQATTNGDKGNRTKDVASRTKAIQRIRTALEARDEALERDGNDILIIAKTACREALGFKEAISRCREFEKMGVDIVYAENFEDAEEYSILCNTMDKKTWLIFPQIQEMKNQSDGDCLSLEAIGALGFDFALKEVAGLQAIVASIKGVAKEILTDEREREPETSASNIPMASYEEVKECLGFVDMESFESEF